MAANVLFVFEGERTEDIIVKSLEKNVLSNKNLIIKCVFAAEIYQLYQEIAEDGDLDTFSLIKGRNIRNRNALTGYSRKDFAEIYLFFDYDAHASVKDGDRKLKDMINLFDNETNNGKLYISYPMVEALRHIVNYDTFHNLTVKCKGNNCPYQDNCDVEDECKNEPHYKTRVSNESIPQLCNINGYTEEIWKKLINAHLSKMNYIVHNIYDYPHTTESQQHIFNKQLMKHINKQCPEVSVLSAFPVFVHDYYGTQRTREFIFGY